MNHLVPKAEGPDRFGIRQASTPHRAHARAGKSTNQDRRNPPARKNRTPGKNELNLMSGIPRAPRIADASEAHAREDDSIPKGPSFAVAPSVGSTERKEPGWAAAAAAAAAAGGGLVWCSPETRRYRPIGIPSSCRTFFSITSLSGKCRRHENDHVNTPKGNTSALKAAEGSSRVS
jgi:hypothetical protein